MKDAVAAVDVAGRGLGFGVHQSAGRGIHQGGCCWSSWARNTAGARFLRTATAAGLPSQGKGSWRGALRMCGGCTGRGGGGRWCPKWHTATPRQALAANVMVLLPVLVLAEGATVACGVASAACLASLATTVPTALREGHGLLWLPNK